MTPPQPPSCTEALAELMALLDPRQHSFAAEQAVVNRARAALAAARKLAAAAADDDDPPLAVGTGVLRVGCCATCGRPLAAEP